MHLYPVKWSIGYVRVCFANLTVPAIKPLFVQRMRTHNTNLLTALDNSEVQTRRCDQQQAVTDSKSPALNDKSDIEAYSAINVEENNLRAEARSIPLQTLPKTYVAKKNQPCVQRSCPAFASSASKHHAQVQRGQYPSSWQRLGDHEILVSRSFSVSTEAAH